MQQFLSISIGVCWIPARRKGRYLFKIIKIVTILLRFQNPFPSVFNSLQFAGTLSDGLGKTMDNRHQSEREYIRYHAATSGEHLVAGIHGLAHGKSHAARLEKNGSDATVPQRCLSTHPVARREKKADNSGDPGWVSGAPDNCQALLFYPPRTWNATACENSSFIFKVPCSCSSFLFSGVCSQSVIRSYQSNPF